MSDQLDMRTRGTRRDDGDFVLNNEHCNRNTDRFVAYKWPARNCRVDFPRLSDILHLHSFRIKRHAIIMTKTATTEPSLVINFQTRFHIFTSQLEDSAWGSQNRFGAVIFYGAAPHNFYVEQETIPKTYVNERK